MLAALSNRKPAATTSTGSTARRIAELGVKAGCEFDKSSALPIRVYSFTVADAVPAPEQQGQQT